MYTRLTTEGRTVVGFMCKVIVLGGAIALGTTGVVAAGESIGRPIATWWHGLTIFSPSHVVPAPLVYRSSLLVQSPTPATVQFHFQPMPVQQSYPVRTYAPERIVPAQVWLGPVRMMTSGFPANSQSGYQHRYFSATYRAGQRPESPSVVRSQEPRPNQQNHRQ
jgi:hypothetical protein